ncbi:MAG TPA: hypothetical protein VEB21_12860 [Terriglobales bacterium]|nr:hypothetical protein [Terriglobales bacterium]
MIDQRQAYAIASKLKADIDEQGRKHANVHIRWDGKLVARYGIRRDRTADHSFIPKQIHVSLREALDLARCPMSAEEYFEQLRQKGLLPEPAQER